MPAIAASQFAPPFMISGVAVALPALGADLGAGATALSLVETLFLAAAVALLLPFGRLGDAADKATLYKLGMAAFALSSIAVGLVSSVWAILALRLLQGACSAAVQAAGPALIADAVPPERRGRAYGITIGAVYAGLTLGPIFAGFLVELAGWRAVFLAGGVVVLLLLAPIHFMLPAAWRRPAPRAVHVPSTVLVSAAMLVLVGGAATLRDGAIGYGAMALGLALLAGAILGRVLPAVIVGVVLCFVLFVGWQMAFAAWGQAAAVELPMTSASQNIEEAFPGGTMLSTGWRLADGRFVFDYEEVLALAPAGVNADEWLWGPEAEAAGIMPAMRGLPGTAYAQWAVLETVGFGVIGLASLALAFPVVDRRRPQR